MVRWFGERYDNVVLSAGFSKAYSSLLAFVAVPATLKRFLKTMVPAYVYGGPVPVASLATTLLGLEINRNRVANTNISGSPVVELPIADPADLDAVGGTCSTGAST